jgi:hypothetical protein
VAAPRLPTLLAQSLLSTTVLQVLPGPPEVNAFIEQLNAAYEEVGV